MKKFLFNLGLSITAGIVAIAVVDTLTRDRNYAYFSGGVTAGAELLFCTFVDVRNRKAERAQREEEADRN